MLVHISLKLPGKYWTCIIKHSSPTYMTSADSPVKLFWGVICHPEHFSSFIMRICCSPPSETPPLFPIIPPAVMGAGRHSHRATGGYKASVYRGSSLLTSDYWLAKWVMGSVTHRCQRLGGWITAGIPVGDASRSWTAGGRRVEDVMLRSCGVWENNRSEHQEAGRPLSQTSFMSFILISAFYKDIELLLLLLKNCFPLFPSKTCSNLLVV